MDDSYEYGGAAAMVRLHEEHLRAFLATWRRARAAGVALPATDDPNYASLDALLRHVLRAARGYMVWTCEVLDLPDPGIRPAPPVEEVEAEAEAYLAHVLDRWRDPLRGVQAERFEDRTYASRWGLDYCIDAMLEHAVMHPIRHAFQLEGLLAGRGG